MDADIERSIKLLKEAQENSKAFNDEIAGRDTGKMQRFSCGKSAGEVKREEEKKERDRAFDAAISIAQQFAEKWNAVQHNLLHAQTEVYEAIQYLEDKLKQQRENALRLDDGRLVFFGENGQPVTEDGEQVQLNVHEAARLDNNTTRLKDYLKTQAALNSMYAHDKSLMDIMERMDEIKDNPSAENLELLDQYQRKIEEIASEAKAIQSTLDTSSHAEAKLEVESKSQIIPDIPMPIN